METQPTKWLRSPDPRACALAAIVLTTAWGCGGANSPAGPGNPDPPAVMAVEVAPSSAQLFVTPPGNSVLLTVIPKDQDGRPMQGMGPPSFSSSNTAIASVDASGKVTAGAVGVAEITASITAGGVTTSGKAQVVVVEPAGAIELVFTRQPSPSLTGLYLTPLVQVTARDSSGRTDTRFEGNVSIALATNPGGATLLGTTTVQAVRGVARFGDLHIREPASGYTLVATATGLNAGTSTDFDVRPSGRIAFVSDRDGAPKIYVMNADGSGVSRLTSGVEADSRPAWSPDGRKIAFARAGDSGTCGIYVMNADGSGLTRLTASCSDGHPTWSPDGARIAFSKWTLGSLGTGIYVMNADGSGVARLTEGLLDAYPAWSPDGRRIAFNLTSEHPVGDWFTQVYVMNADGSGARRLTSYGQGEFAEGGPAWSPDGFTIAFWSYASGVATIHSDIPGFPSTVYKGTADLFSIGEVDFGSTPDWSPDGRKIVFPRRVHGQRKLTIADALGGGSLQLLSTGSVGEDYEPAWSRVGSR